MTPADLLGRTHPLSRATRRFATACLQLASGLVLLTIMILFARGPARALEVAVGAGTSAVLGCFVAAGWCRRRRCALELIIGGDEHLPLIELAALRQRLRDPRRRARLASSLERCLRSAERWDRTAPNMRPVANVRLLLPLADDVRAIAHLLRAATVPRVRGVALCESLLTDGAGSPLYGNDAEGLRRELGRIRFSLQAS
jgi:hypothetical protein